MRVVSVRARLLSSLALALAVFATPALAGRRAASRGRVVKIAAPPPEQVEVPAGVFSMGLEPQTVELLESSCRELLGPLGESCAVLNRQLGGMTMRDVFVARFAIGRTEVSVAQYRACVAAGACALEPLVLTDEHYLGDALPVVNVTWWEASEYCRWRGGRLPTEAEWERAARGDDQRPWPWGELSRPGDFNHGRVTSEVARTPAALSRWSGGAEDLLGEPDDEDDGVLLLAPVGRYPWGAGPYGALDQAGNVAEWVYDAWSAAGYESLSSSNPAREPSLFDARVVRGGSWRQPPLAARVDTRSLYADQFLPATRSILLGFRCAWDRR